MSDLLKENVEPITITNACQVFFGSPCRKSVEENLFSLATITVSYFFFVQKAIKSRIGSHYRKSISTNENKKSKKGFSHNFTNESLPLRNLYPLICRDDSLLYLALFKYVVFNTMIK